MYQDKEIGRFEHEKNIQIGNGRIMWSDGSQPYILKTNGKGVVFAEEGPKIEAGWVLPGGGRTNDKAVAEMAAMFIDQNTRL